MDLHAELQRNFPSAIKGSCNKEGCRLKFDKLPSSHRRTIMDVDAYAESRRRKGKLCDYFLFLSKPELIVLVVEMKSGRVSAGRAEAKAIAQQLSNGAKAAEKLVQDYPVSLFVPVLLYGSMRSGMPGLLAECEVPFGTHSYRILTGRCGCNLRDFL